jgi:hypothetical protein
MTVDEGLDTAALTSVFLCRQNATMGGFTFFNFFPMTTDMPEIFSKEGLPMSQHFVSPGHSLDDIGRSKIDIIDHNSNWKENPRKTRESFCIRELQTLYPCPFILLLNGWTLSPT